MRVCSGCLATDGRLFDIRERLLEQAFAELTGLADCGGWLCVVCLQLLRKFTEFRARCLCSRRALQQLKSLNQDNFLLVDRSCLKHNLKKSEIIFLSCDSVETENLNKNFPQNVIVPSAGHNDTVLLQYYIKSAENDSPAKEKPLKIETCRIKNKNTYDNQTEIHIDILDNNQFSCNNDLTNQIDNINNENGCTNIENITIETNVLEYESLDPNDDTLEDNNQVFENYHHETSTNASDTDNDLGIFEPKNTNQLKQLSLNEKQMNNDISQLFRDIWRRVIITDDGNFYRMFERLYKVSLDTKLTVTTVDCQKRKIENGIELENWLSFLSMYKQVADMNNVSIEFISIEAERVAMDLKRQSADARQCALCCRVYTTADTLRRHEKRSHNESLPYRCLVCLYTFKKQAEYLMHLLKMHATRKTCKECGQNIATVEQKSHWGEVHQHVDEVHRKALVHCQYCGHSFNNRKNCNMHIRSAHRAQMDAVQCLLCGDIYNGRVGLRVHVVRMHPMAVRCGDCAVWFANEAARAAHTPAGGHCRKDLSGCPLCGCTFSTERLMREHYDGTHALYKCPNCILTFIELKSYKDHYYKMCYDGFHRLPRAQKSKTQKKTATVKAKRKQYQKKDSYICDICGKGARCAATLRYHQRVHTGEKPYKCEYCGKAFATTAALYVHTWTHTDERRYKCELCPKAFRQAPHLRAHMPSHTNEKNYACTQCSKRYTSSYSLRQHVRTVHEGLSPVRRNRQKKKPC